MKPYHETCLIHSCSSSTASYVKLHCAACAKCRQWRAAWARLPVHWMAGHGLSTAKMVARVLWRCKSTVSCAHCRTPFVVRTSGMRNSQHDRGLCCSSPPTIALHTNTTDGSRRHDVAAAARGFCRALARFACKLSGCHVCMQHCAAALPCCLIPTMHRCPC